MTTAAPPRIPYQIWVLVGAAFVIAIGYGLISPILPSYAQSFNVGVAAASVIVSAFAFFRLIFAPVGGRLVTSLGERPVYLVGLAIVALSSIATAYAPSYPMLLLLRGLGGIGSTMFTISAMALLVRLAPPTIRGRVSSAYGSAFLIGGMIGPVVGGFLAEFGLRAPFIIYGIALFAAMAVVGIGLRGATLHIVKTDDERPAMTLAEAWSNPTYRAVLAANVAHGWVNFGVRNAVLPLLAVAVFDRTWVAGAVLAIGAVGTASSLQVSGKLADKIGRRPLVIIGLSTLAVTVGLFGTAVHSGLSTAAGLTILFALSLVAGVGAGFIGPGQQAAVADIIGNDRSGGTVLSVFQMSSDAGAIVGPILIGVVADQFGFGTAFAVTGLVCAVGVLPWLRAPDSMELATA